MVKQTKEILQTKLETADIEYLRLLNCSAIMPLFKSTVMIKDIKISHSAAGKSSDRLKLAIPLSIATKNKVRPSIVYYISKFLDGAYKESAKPKLYSYTMEYCQFLALTHVICKRVY